MGTESLSLIVTAAMVSIRNHLLLQIIVKRYILYLVLILNVMFLLIIENRISINVL